MTNACVIVLVGLPASGKTTFATSLSDHVASSSRRDVRYEVVHVCYDDLISFEDDPSSWRDVRKNLVSRVDELVSLNVGKPPVQPENRQDGEITFARGRTIKTLIIVDDNMYYRSMRYEFYRLARTRNLSFCQLYFECAKETALKNNLMRDGKSRVPDDVIVRMSSKLELPDGDRNRWERFSLTLPPCTYNAEVHRRVLQLVEEAMAEVFTPTEGVPPEDRDASRAECSANLLHQVDILSRKQLGLIMAQKNKEGLSKQELSKISTCLNSKRLGLLSKIKVGEVVCPEVAHGSSPEIVLKDWVAEVFGSL
ncbi:L-seryl-tRNA(Sec) kinase [Bacillus rossius redtenbacheri]|uniref:L-seryl-tRNA(Sec) kinase n=1 Tax=Bacillus rossius redtenbacheri TaxID=93214 RepID=UPI002FDCC41F